MRTSIQNAEAKDEPGLRVVFFCQVKSHRSAMPPRFRPARVCLQIEPIGFRNLGGTKQPLIAGCPLLLVLHRAAFWGIYLQAVTSFGRITTVTENQHHLGPNGSVPFTGRSTLAGKSLGFCPRPYDLAYSRIPSLICRIHRLITRR
jgi:hypothetical protein